MVNKNIKQNEMVHTCLVWYFFRAVLSNHFSFIFIRFFEIASILFSFKKATRFTDSAGDIYIYEHICKCRLATRNNNNNLSSSASRGWLTTKGALTTAVGRQNFTGVQLRNSAASFSSWLFSAMAVIRDGNILAEIRPLALQNLRNPLIYFISLLRIPHCYSAPPLLWRNAEPIQKSFITFCQTRSVEDNSPL